MSTNLQSESLPMSMVIIRLARARACDLSVGRVQVQVQVQVQVHVPTCSILTPCQSSMALMVKGWQNPWGMGDFRNPVFNM